MNMLDKLSLAGIVPVIKIEDANDAVNLVGALKRGGLPVAEITFRSDAAEQSIKNIHEAMPDVLLGAGTVLTKEQVDRAKGAGASYIVSPGLNPEVVKHCQKVGIEVLPGCANPSDIEMALGLGLDTVKFFPAEALGGLNLIKAMSAPYGNVMFVPTGGIGEKNVLDYLAFNKVRAVGGSWMVPGDAVKAKDWGRIENLTRSAIDLMLGFTLRHIGLNSDSPKQAEKEAKAFSMLTGWPIHDGNSSMFVGTGFELMKKPFRGTHGHIAIGTNNVDRAKWHLEQRGFAFDEDSATIKGDKLFAIYFKEEIAGFAVHLVQK